MASSRHRFAIWMCIIGAATLTIGIGVASGAKKLKTASDSAAIDFEDDGTATARCAQGTKAISGGFEGEVGIENPSDPFVVPFGSHRVGGREWSTSAMNFEDTGDITSFAYCRDAKVKTVTESTTVEDFDENDSETATCPQGYKAISGGFDNPDFGYNTPFGPGIFPTASRKSGKRAWTVDVSNPGNDSGILEVSVNCRKGKGLKTRQEDTFIGGPGLHDATADCRVRQRVLSGGFEIDLIADPEDVEIFTSKKVGKRGWTVEAGDFESETTLTAFAYCEKKKKKK